MKQHTKKMLDTAINGPDDKAITAIYYVNPTTGKRHLYAAWPPIPGISPGDAVTPEVEEKLKAHGHVLADSPETTT